MSAILAIVGRPNVGKSTLFNRLIGARKALVLDTPGVTRDRNYDRCEWENRQLTVIDTGGFDPHSEEGMLPEMRTQARIAMEESDAILFVVDGREGLTPADEEVFGLLRGTERPLFVVVNKIEAKGQMSDVFEFHALGVDELFPVSAEHGLGIGDLMERVVASLPEAPPALEEENPEELERLRIAVVGRPNAGKSTLINRILGEERLITSEIPGTTRDSIDIAFQHGERRYTLVDTVGMRRRRGITARLEKFGVIKAMESIDRAHLVILMTDATEGVTDQDARIANMAVDRGRAVVLGLNKWDLVEKDHRTADQLITEIRSRMPSLAFMPALTLSAKSGQRVTKLLEVVDTVTDNWRRRVPTGELNRWFDEVTRRQPPPLHKNRAVRMYYVTQARTAPPLFVIQTNMDPSGVPVSYHRYLVNQLRATYDFEGTPLRVVFRKRGKRP